METYSTLRRISQLACIIAALDAERRGSQYDRLRRPASEGGRSYANNAAA
jgi:hypothetical protein